MITAVHNAANPPTAKISLWVEDSLTKAYLDAIWAKNSTLLTIGSATGGDSVSKAVSRDRDNGLTNSFGIRDRDFGPLKPPSRNTKVFVLHAHEIENYMLDWDAMASVQPNIPAATFEAECSKAARAMLEWLVCCRQLFELKCVATEDFPSNPAKNLTDAEAYITASPWYTQKLAALSAACDPANLKQSIAQFRQDCTSLLPPAGTTWTAEFPGKELMAPLWNLLRGGNARKSNEDIAREIGEAQVAQNTVPKELDHILSNIAARLGVTLN